MSEIKELYYIRDYLESDKAFIKATFLRGLYYSDSWFSVIPKDIFMKNYSLFIDKLLEKYAGSTKLACLIEDPDVILGYAILGTDNTAHWAFVKKAWRRQGIARSLLPKDLAIVTHLNMLGRTLCYGGIDTDTNDRIVPKYPNVVFNPFKL